MSHFKIDFVKAYQKLEEAWEEFPPVKKRRRRRKIKKFFKIFAFLLFLFLFLLVIFSFWFFLNLKSVYSTAQEGKELVYRSADSIKAREFNQAEEWSGRAQEKFKKVKARIDSWEDNFFLSYFPITRKEIENLSHLSETAFILSKTLNKGAKLGVELEEYLTPKRNLKFSELNKEEKRKILKIIYESRPEFNGLKANLNLALWELKKVEFHPFLVFLQSWVEEGEKKLEEVNRLAGDFTRAFCLLPELAGYPDQSDFLIMFQNSNELRPTGGFLGTYGILQVKNGEIKRFDTHDIYHMDMPVKDKISVTPPKPIARHLNSNWYLRDANWSPDWPTSAQKINWFYHKENSLLPPKDQINDFSGEFEGVVGVIPQLVIDILGITGPVYVEGQEYNQENFLDLLQYEVEKGYKNDRSSWERKEVIGKVLSELKIKFFDLPFSAWPRLKRVFSGNVSAGNFLINLNEEYYQNLAKELDWTGEIKKTKGDYLMSVDSNMGALKTDSVIDRRINYELEKGPNGLFANLKIQYSHNGEINWKISDYKSYTRVFVPRGSEFISLEGENVSFPAGKKVKIKQDLGKTSLGVFFSLKAGEIGALNYKYKLPAYLNKKLEQGEYSLYLQKQPGSKISFLKVDIETEDEIKSYNPVGFHAQEKPEGRGVSWETNFFEDKFFEISVE